MTSNHLPLMKAELQTALNLLVTTTTSIWGQEFFNRFVQSLSLAFDIDHVLITIKNDDQLHTAKCCALWADGILGDSFHYELKDSACLRVLQTGETLRCLKDAHLHFRRNRYIVSMPAHCYLGVPIKNNLGETIGLIAVLDRQPLVDPLMVETVMELFKGRIAADLEHQAVETTLSRVARQDALTSLPNRYALMEILHQVCQSQQPSAVLFLDFDRFKYVNDQWGHEFGDRLLVEVGKCLQGISDGLGTVARFGGDEFVFVATPIQGEADAIQLAERINQSLQCLSNFEGHYISLSASIGIVLYDHNLNATPDILLRNADIAMYQAKARGLGSYKIFEEADYQRLKHRVNLETDLRKAIKNNEFVVRYQPIIAIATGKLSGFEALATWQHPEHGLLFPDKFIPMAEELGLISEIDRLIFEQACLYFKTWQVQGLITSQAYLSVNLSVKDLVNSSITGYIEKRLLDLELAPQCLNIEITESDCM
ncbi:MAG: bifunctional diguanylate cyclase/phosphodiesterase, partial [Prochlorotrichaceae cyanobacterium]